MTGREAPHTSHAGIPVLLTSVLRAEAKTSCSRWFVTVSEFHRPSCPNLLSGAAIEETFLFISKREYSVW